MEDIFTIYLVRVPISSVDTTMLVVELHSTSNRLGEGEAGGPGMNWAGLIFMFRVI